MKLGLLAILLAAAAATVFISCGRTREEALAPPDTKDTNKVALLLNLRGCQTREEWVSQYLKHFPDAHPLAVIGDYNADAGFTSRWKPFSLSEMQALVGQNRKGQAK
jgi:hypothetical protein